MTVEELLTQLKRDRRNAQCSVWIYGSRSIESRSQGDDDDANFWREQHNKSYEEEQRLRIVIKEIEKRVS